VEGRKEKEEYTMVGAAEADPINGKISNESPIGKALMNKKEGDKVQVETPAGVLVIKVVKLN
jgi:transcription elongation factor GreA